MTEFISSIDYALPDGSRIREMADGISCSHNDFKKICMSCLKHFSKDLKLREAFYELNKQAPRQLYQMDEKA